MTSRRLQTTATLNGQTPSEPEVLKALRVRVTIETLPVTRDFLRQKRLVEERGELALIEDGLPMHHLGYFSLIPGKGFRGGHFHRAKTEHFYVVSGVLSLLLVDVDMGLGAEVRLRDGNKVTIRPGCAHRFAAETPAQVIEYYEGSYEKEDDHPFSFGDAALPRIDAQAFAAG